MIPREIPSEIEYRKGIAMMVMKAGMASSVSFQSSLVTCCIIRNPTTIRAGAVAKEGIDRKIGEKNRDSANKAPVVMAVSPVRPPSIIPEEDSTKVVTQGIIVQCVKNMQE